MRRVVAVLLALLPVLAALNLAPATPVQTADAPHVDVTNDSSSTVSVIDSATDSVIAAMRINHNQ